MRASLERSAPRNFGDGVYGTAQGMGNRNTAAFSMESWEWQGCAGCKRIIQQQGGEGEARCTLLGSARETISGSFRKPAAFPSAVDEQQLQKSRS
ncbi:hypothetical protein EON66_09820 [archaeon]|nr:MAG: hypothetical protein EON66_09820 [archaeon]